MPNRPRREALTLKRIYGAPLDGTSLSLIAWSPDGKLLTYVASRSEAVELMAYDVAGKKKRVLFDWSEILDPSHSRRKVIWDADGDTLPWRIRTFRAERELSLYYAWSPAGDVILLAPTMDGPYYLFNLATETISPQLAIDPAACDITFSPDGRWITYALNYNLFILDTTNGRNIPLTQGGTEPFRFATPDTMGDFLIDSYWWSPDSSGIACLVTNESAVPQFPCQDLTSSKGSLDFERYPMPGDSNPHMSLVVISAEGQTWIDGGPWRDYYLARVQWLDSRRLALQFLNREQNHLVLAIADSGTGRLTRVLEESSTTWINLANDLQFLANGSMFLWSAERESLRQLYLYSVDGCELAQLTSGDAASVSVKSVDETNGAIYFHAYPSPYINSELRRVTYRMEGDHVVASPVETLTRGPGVHGAILSPDCSYFADHCSTATSPPELNVYTRDGKLVEALESNPVRELAGMLQPVEFLPLLPAARIGDPSDDMLLCHRVLRPRDMRKGHKYPAIVYVYGGPVPGGSGRTVVNKWVHVPDLWAQLMASQGFVVYSLDNRGSCEAPRGHRFEKAIRYQLGLVELADQLEGVKYLKSLPFVDPARIGVFGGSFGGFMALNCMLRAPQEFKAGVAFAPVTDWSCYDAIYTEQYMGQPQVNVAGYRLTQLPQLAGNLRGKLLLLHGTADQNVHLDHTFSLVDAFVSAGKEVEMMMYPGMDHADFFQVGPAQQQLFERITEFFVEHL